MIFLLSVLNVGFTVEQIKGVSPTNAGRYRRAISIRKNTFTCFDKSKTISFDRVNDGYCDCPDGSDEPGTNACGTGEFYCRNTGSQPKMIPKWMVNDGVCDCCDGSDEIGNPHAHCEDMCGAIRRRSIQFRANLTNMTAEGSKLRTKYSERGRLELSVRRKQLQHIDSLKPKIFQVAELAEKIYWNIKTNDDDPEMLNQMSLTMNQIQTEFTEVEITEESLRKGYRKVKEELPHKGRFNLKHRKDLYFNVENCIVWLPDFSFVFYRMRTAYDIIKGFYDNFLKGDLPPKATSSFNKITAITSKIENSTIKIQSKMQLDFGPDKEFLPLYKQWYYYENDDYYIELYPYCNCTKHYKKGGGEFKFGNYNYSQPFKWIFNGGDHCMYGHPGAELEVRLHCQLKNSILHFKENSKCFYRIDFGTPTACVDEYKTCVESMDDVTLDEWAKDSGIYN